MKSVDEFFEELAPKLRSRMERELSVQLLMIGMRFLELLGKALKVLQWWGERETERKGDRERGRQREGETDR